MTTEETATIIEAVCADIRANNRVNDKWYIATLCKANGISEKHIRTILKAE